MAEYLGSYNKNVLILLADDFGISISSSEKKMGIIKKIVEASDYSEQYAKNCLGVIVEEEKERKARESEEEKERKARELEAQRLREERDFELQKLQLTQSAETNRVVSARNENARPSRTLKMQKYDPEKSDMALYLTLFERQARKKEIDEADWVTQLIELLPLDIAQIIVKISDDKWDDYEHIKSVLLGRFKLSPEAFRTKFQTHKRQEGTLWQDMIFELRTYLEGWLEGIEVIDYETLKDLMIADQLKKRCPMEMKEHFIDDWGNLNDPDDLAKKLDQYEASRRFLKKPQIFKPAEKRVVDRPKIEKPPVEKNAESDKSEPSSGYCKKNIDPEWRRREFEKKREVVCYNCNKPGHIKPDCPEPKKEVGMVNSLATTKIFDPSFKPYLSQAKVNSREMTVLRDTGSNLDLAPFCVTRPEDFTGETVLIKQPLDNEFRRLPLARVILDGPDFAEIVTKAAIVGSSIEMNHYLLGNVTQALIDSHRINPQMINAVMTRSRCREENNSGVELREDSRGEMADKESSLGDNVEECNDHFPQEKNEQINLPPVEACPAQELVDVDANEFLEEQKKCPSLASTWEKVKSGKTTEFEIEGNLLYRKSVDHRELVRKQLLVPAKYRSRILSLCHEGFGSHMGITKSKDKILRYYFWPQCFKEIEEFVKTCDACQRVGKPSEQKKAPLKIVPVITEVFSKINIDTVGPLPVSSRNHKYLLTCIDVASKYQERLKLSRKLAPCHKKNLNFKTCKSIKGRKAKLRKSTRMKEKKLSVEWKQKERPAYFWGKLPIFAAYLFWWKSLGRFKWKRKWACRLFEQDAAKLIE